ncbi:hypothetical protein ABZ490_40755 [Streptomyces sp. NPDC005811]|uniref:hypothetical protein n=1 Tax=Streptomyces sp. NPDC005811 TaxID=3154565 RepID=UPI0033DE9139
MRWRARRKATVILGSALATTLLGVSGCADIHDIRYTLDHRITITAPRNLATVTMPTVMRWRLNDPSVLKDGRKFAVVVDRDVMPPGHPLKDLLTDPCAGDFPQCPDPEVLADGYHTYLTTRSRVTIPSVVSQQGAAEGDSHTAMIILIDAAGKRVGDAYWRISFRVSS